MREPEGFREFIATRSRSLLRTAWLLTGDWALAQDLVQTSFVKTWAQWTRVDYPDAYVRRVMFSTFLTWRRRRWWIETPISGPESATTDDPYADVDLRQSLNAALAQLPRRQRAVVVLRFFSDLSEPQVAELLGCSVGTIKSQTAKALTRLRASSLAELLDLEVSDDRG